MFDVIERYVERCKLDIQNSGEMYAYEVPMDTNNTSIVYAWFEDGVFAFRFHTELKGVVYPIAQYVTVDCSGRMAFRTDGRWFVPIGNDVLFDSFSDALRFAKDCSEALAAYDNRRFNESVESEGL